MKVKLLIIQIALTLSLFSCGRVETQNSIRMPVDTVGFATKTYQVDSILSRVRELQGDLLDMAPNIGACRMALCPHDDYTYVGWLYPATLRNITAQKVILFGVAHKAKRFGLENKLIFDGFDSWMGPYGNIKISDLRNEIIKKLPRSDAIKHDSMQMVEHSIESMLPLLQFQNRDLEIVPILVPYMKLERMDSIARNLAGVLHEIFNSRQLNWGTDVAMVVTTDAVHYGDMDWGGKNYAPFGTDSSGYAKAKTFEQEILNSTLTGTLASEMIRNFYGYTIDSADYKKYRWTWCGRYSVPFALFTALYLSELQNSQDLVGLPVGYSTSIENIPIPVDDLCMGQTAPANLRHWVGYAAVVYP